MPVSSIFPALLPLRFGAPRSLILHLLYVVIARFDFAAVRLDLLSTTQIH